VPEQKSSGGTGTFFKTSRWAEHASHLNILKNVPAAAAGYARLATQIAEKPPPGLRRFVTWPW
jgi:hypothetical protein